MPDKNILMSAPMIQALLDDRKTHTRRIVKPQPDSVKMLGRAIPYRFAPPPPDMPSATLEVPIRCPYGAPGDFTWVRETLRRSPHAWTYDADGTEVGWPARKYIGGIKREVIVSIHMPRVVSRLTLKITEVRVERLQDISEADALAEGVTAAKGGGFDVPGTICFSGTPQSTYAALWRQINGADSWDANPWVWVVVFETIKANIDVAKG